MAGGFHSGLRMTAVASNVPVSSGGIALTAGASANTLGSYSEIITSIPRDSTWAEVIIRDIISTAGVVVNLVNIATGTAGSEVVRVADLVVTRDATSGQAGGSAIYFFPLAIPAGTRIAANCQSQIASGQVAIAMTFFDDAFDSCGVGGPIDTYGTNLATGNGTQIDPGATANTKGAYVVMSASTTADLAGFFIGFDGSGTPGSVVISISVDVAVGASGSEVVILPDWQFVMVCVSTRRAIYPQSTPFFPIHIPAGSRIAIRASCSSASSPSRLFDATVYGVRL